MVGVAYRIVRLHAAPFPDPPLAFDGPVVGGQPTRITSTGAHAPRHPHYTDDRVLLASPPAPRGLALFFHGHMGEIDRDVRLRWDMAGQAAAGGAALIAPQLGLEVADSYPGKLGRPGGTAALVAEAAPHLAELSGLSTAQVEDLPLVLAGFSGGWRALESSLTSGGLGDRVAGIVVLDALFGGLDTVTEWCLEGRGWLVAVSGSRCAEAMTELADALSTAGIARATEVPARLGPGTVALIDSKHDHWDIPGAGRPVEAILSRWTGRRAERG
ncbi:MAG: hypothetical protein H6843_16760 [Rhodospirillaceae bacterium]|nr:hypothetical protein [Rhodospirillaceae bacterium]